MALASRDEFDLARRCLSTLVSEFRDSSRGCASARSIASALQEWGIASLPATVVRAEPSRPRPLGLTFGALLARAGIRPNEALRGAKVIDCGQLVSAPCASAFLTLLGADVQVVAHPARLRSRRYGGAAASLDLNAEADRRKFADLCPDADLVLDNFRPRVWTNLRLDPVALGATRHLSLPAFGRSDTRRNLKVYGFQLEAMTGIGHTPTPFVTSPSRASSRALLDHAVGLAAGAVAAHLLAAGATGRFELTHSALLDFATRE
jgi:crotonobetainyl-CoA:carnitine CoA-transferase CaiB-like acyl-CoA transferase